MIRELGKFAEKEIPNTRVVDLAELRPGVNDVGNHLIKLSEAGELEYVIDKVCSHAGGRMILKDGKAVCPMHGWELDLNSLQYNDSHVCKEKCSVALNEEGKILIDDPERWLENLFKQTKQGSLKIRWLNHATVYVECRGISLITDPWLFGPAFMTGWWLAEPSPADAVDLLKQADFVYISHNHPDHLHAETLAVLPRDKQLLVADFATQSSEKYLRMLGFTNINALAFNTIYEIGEVLQLCLFKSGDFRDDSGLYLCADGYECLFTVDAKFLNSHILPRSIDLLLTSFAGGASGFPLCFDNYSAEEKTKIVQRNKKSARFAAMQYLEVVRPAHFLPYAGMFREYAERDAFIAAHNRKNSPADYRSICESMGIELIEPRSDRELRFEAGTLQTVAIKTKSMKQEEPPFYINILKDEYHYKPLVVLEYLRASSYSGSQILQILPAADDFALVSDQLIYADFKKKEFRIISPENLIEEKERYRVMQLRVRPEVLMCVVENKLPWEDISIGFQMRVKRNPNVYESDFWYYFTNEYIGSTHFRYSSFCGACTVVEQNPIWIA